MRGGSSGNKVSIPLTPLIKTPLRSQLIRQSKVKTAFRLRSEIFQGKLSRSKALEPLITALMSLACGTMKKLK